MDELKETRPKHKMLTLYSIFSSLIIIIILIGLGVYIIKQHDNIYLPYPISKQAAEQLGFNIYYPNSKLLPSGYILNKGSFSSTSQVLIYSVSYGNQKIVFSDQPKPTYNQLLSFVNNNIPLNTTFSTSVGTATIGAIKNQTVVSLPTNSDSWLIITSPESINQNDLDQVLSSIELAK